jgi:hypothetical protein
MSRLQELATSDDAGERGDESNIGFDDAFHQKWLRIEKIAWTLCGDL